LLDTFLALLEGGNDAIRKVALVMDARERDFPKKWPRVFESAARAGYRLEVVFLDATDASLIRRFSETHRRHPLAPQGKRTQGKDAIAIERDLLGELRARADLVIDTTDLNVH